MKPTSFVPRMAQKMAGSSWFRVVGPKVVPPADKVLTRLTGGRFLLSAAIVPSLVLTTIGAKSGEPRLAPLATLPRDDGSFYVVGSNFGRATHPAWTGNLIAHPAATVMYRGRTVDVVATLLDGEEKAAIWPQLTAIWPTYDRYVEVSGRDIRVFHLMPA